ncbi:methyltransferase domain-containing protein [Novosphingobium aerophilum]|uniref:Methyltransferase domain-containing protein n=1 Tax=Novosphingobium aerophilum TaxID=2839843 RepID=A0A7X1KB49_9SPHN|nr:methyltransferase domain-containing protein [Novosphingobium aerophilum]MBC2650931.1 methyltransferase domain-containing protein [Novosphingobium aerophilum]
MSSGYHSSRLVQDARRDVVWKALWRHHFRHQIRPDDTVLDLGCGYGEFINNVVARRRIGLDQWAGSADHLAPGVESVVAPVTDLGAIADGSIDFAFASNLFEHIPQEAFARVLEQLRGKLAKGGTLNILQPNYRYAYAEYFDDYTHVAIYSHVSLADFLAANGFEVIDLRPRFLPLTVKSRLPVSPTLIGLYLAMPFKPLGKQMLVRARPRD